MKIDFCPGASNVKGTPTLTIKHCPRCHAEIEMFSTDSKRNCAKCGQEVYNDAASCVKWCAAARDCVGDELYEKLTGKSEK